MPSDSSSTARRSWEFRAFRVDLDVTFSLLFLLVLPLSIHACNSCCHHLTRRRFSPPPRHEGCQTSENCGSIRSDGLYTALNIRPPPNREAKYIQLTLSSFKYLDVIRMLHVLAGSRIFFEAYCQKCPLFHLSSSAHVASFSISCTCTCYKHMLSKAGLILGQSFSVLTHPFPHSSLYLSSPNNILNPQQLDSSSHNTISFTPHDQVAIRGNT